MKLKAFFPHVSYRIVIPLFDSTSKRSPAYVTLFLILVNVLVFACQFVLAQQGRLESFFSEYALVPASLFKEPDGGAFLSVLTSMFLHGGPLHLVSNLWFLWIFGPPVEVRFGPFTFLVFYLLGGIGAAVAQVAVAPGSDLPMVGASGAVSAVLGAYLLLFPFAAIIAFVPWIIPIIPVPAFIFIILWFGLQLMQGAAQVMNAELGAGGVAWWAHLGGFAVGLMMAVWLKKRNKRSRSS